MVISKCSIVGYGELDLEGKLSNCSVVNVDLKSSFKIIFALSIDSVILLLASPSGPFKVVIPVVCSCLALIYLQNSLLSFEDEKMLVI